MDWTGLVGILVTLIWHKIMDKKFPYETAIYTSQTLIMEFSKAEYISYHTK